MASLILAALIFQAQPAFDFEVKSGSGLKLSVSGIPIIEGSSLQYYENGWLKGYYSTSYSGQTIEKVDNDTVRVKYSGYNGLAFGQILYHRDGDRLKVHYDLSWNDENPAEIELTAGLLSAQALQTGMLSVEGKPTRSLKTHDYSGTGDFESRRYAPDASSFVFESPLAKLEARTSLPTTLFDARGYSQDYAEGKDIWWFGLLKMDVSKDKTTSFDVEWRVTPRPIPEPNAAKLKLTSQPSDSIIVPESEMPVIVPRPTINQLSTKSVLEFTGAYDWPAGRVRFWIPDFIGTLAKRFELPVVLPNAKHMKVDGGVSKLGLHPGGYQITITDSSISVLGEEDEGLHNGLRKLAQLAFVKSGKIVLPTGFLRDSPKLLWRGVHLFVGPEARAFQKKLWDRVLLPLGFNQAVLQCERTQWQCLPKLKESKGTMTKEELANLFKDYKAIGIDAIPLIQSFGHMEWFFTGGDNLDLAVNPQEPYTIDPRKPRSAELLKTLWGEAAALLKPSMIHFGCDEVDMIGFPNDKANWTTDLWTAQMPTLNQIASQNAAKMMIWGDEGLAPKEAVDATNGETPEIAAKRRAAIPKGTWIADWHYKESTKPEAFLPSLQLWKKEGLVPIASTWFQPDNIRSFDLAADVEHTGSLQTTWSGYFSNEQTIDDNFEQYSAMVLSAEYSWSSRFDPVARLGYDPGSIFRKLYFGMPRPITNRKGMQFYLGSGAKDLVDGDMHFKLGDPITLRSLISSADAPTSVDLSFEGKGSHIGIVLDTFNRAAVGEPVADLIVDLSGNKQVKVGLRYGQHVRSNEDLRASSRSDTVDGLSVLEIPLGESAQVKGLKLNMRNSVTGLRIHGLIIW